MPGPSASKAGARPKKLFPNPFYVLLLVVSVAFVVTTLGYLIGPTIQDQARNARPGVPKPGPGSLALASWFDRQGPLALAVEVVVMVAAGALAMLTDRWFPERA